MSKTRGFTVDFKMEDGQVITRHTHKLNEVKGFVDQYKIPAITIHSRADKWSGDWKQVSDLKQWPLVPELIDEREDDCPICNPPKEK